MPPAKAQLERTQIHDPGRREVTRDLVIEARSAGMQWTGIEG